MIPDLLARQAGLLLGARPATHAENWPAVVVQAALLIAAGADIGEHPDAVLLGMERARMH
jgi:hypothetical protein